MMSKGKGFSAVTALALGLAASAHPGLRAQSNGVSPRPRYYSDEQAAADRERAEWNKGVEARKAERRARRGK